MGRASRRKLTRAEINRGIEAVCYLLVLLRGDDRYHNSFRGWCESRGVSLESIRPGPDERRILDTLMSDPHALTASIATLVESIGIARFEWLVALLAEDFVHQVEFRLAGGSTWALWPALVDHGPPDLPPGKRAHSSVRESVAWWYRKNVAGESVRAIGREYAAAAQRHNDARAVPGERIALVETWFRRFRLRDLGEVVKTDTIH